MKQPGSVPVWHLPAVCLTTTSKSGNRITVVAELDAGDRAKMSDTGDENVLGRAGPRDRERTLAELGQAVPIMIEGKYLSRKLFVTSNRRSDTAGPEFENAPKCRVEVPGDWHRASERLQVGA